MAEPVDRGAAVRSWLKTHAAVVASLAVWLLLVALDYWTLWPILRRPASKDTATVLAAAITVNGALLTAAVTYAGLLFKRAADMRAAEAAAQAETRAVLEQQRQHMEAAMRAVSLLVTDGKPAPPYQSSALLVVLAELGQLSLAVDLATELWPADAITRSCGVELVDRCIRSGKPELQIVGMRLLAANGSRLVFKRVVSESDGRHEQVVESWPKSLALLGEPPPDPTIQTLLDQAKAAVRDQILALQQS
jgi:hypothetical protein